MSRANAPELNEEHMCKMCCGFLGQPFVNDGSDGSAGGSCCRVCLGLWCDDASSALTDAIDKACEPYGGIEANRFSVEQPPSIVVPGDVALRYHLAALDKDDCATIVNLFESPQDASQDDCFGARKGETESSYKRISSMCRIGGTRVLCAVHIVMTPMQHVSRPSTFVVKANKKRVRKRFRGHDPTEKQGGDPRVNLERRLLKQGVELWSCADVDAVLRGASSPATRETLAEWFRTTSVVSSSPAIQYNVAVWRRPFFLRGLYTKSRRDVSQTPFYVSSEANGKPTMKRLGVTSVEEQINPVISKVACGGISTLNNDPDGGDTVYSMIQVSRLRKRRHGCQDAVGPPSPEPTDNVGGRPFVCQVVDALRMPAMDQIMMVPPMVNHTNVENGTIDEGDEVAERRYGRNPLGVDIAPCFTFVPSLAYKNLQSETEEKVKYYGCLCWCELEIESQQDLEKRLGSFPLQLNQKTPIRVLHRRSNAIRIRHVLTCKPTVIDKHHFRLNLSTDAGTYVKEFVHGDLGRTTPNVSSLLECKTDILELDCEGIAGV